MDATGISLDAFFSIIAGSAVIFVMAKIASHEPGGLHKYRRMYKHARHRHNAH